MPEIAEPVSQRLPPWAFSAFLVLLNMFIPLSTDLYLPALPTMGAEFGAPAALVNLSLSSFFLCYTLGLLFIGPISDKHGRRPALLGALVLYIVSSAASSFAVSVWQLIACRMVQGIASGGVLSVTMAVIKDSYQGRKREKALAVTQTFGGLAPMLAPVAGAWILSVSDWRATFRVLAAIGVAAFLFALRFRETLRPGERYRGSVWGALGRLGVVLRNRSVLFPLLIFGLGGLPFMGYISISSYIYMEQFDLSAQQYSFFFAANAFMTISGPFLYVKLSPRINRRWFSAGVFAVMLCSGLAVIALGSRSPFWFLGTYVFTSLVGALSRPFSTNLVFEQHEGDAGALSAVLGTVMTVMGSLGMLLASLPSGNWVPWLGGLIVGAAVLALAAWIALMRSSVPLRGIKTES